MGSGVVRRGCLVLLGIALTVPLTAHGQTPSTSKTFALLASGPEGSETVLATEMISLLQAEDGARVTIERGDTGFNSIVRLLAEAGTGAAFVSTDALAYARDMEQTANTENLTLLARLAPQEIHLLAGRQYKAITDLAGQKVAVGSAGSGAAITASAFFSALNITIQPIEAEGAAALDMLGRDEIAAVFLIGGKPLPLLASRPVSSHLLPIPFSPELQAAYLPTRLEHADYPALVAENADVPTVATGLVLLAARNKGEADRGAYEAWLADVVGQVFSNFDRLRSGDHHPKWDEVNLSAGLPGYARASAAEAWLAGQPAAVAGANHEGGSSEEASDETVEPTLSSTVSMSDDKKEALFKEFNAWRRARQH